MEDKDRNPRRGSVDTPRLPSKVTIFDLLQIILGIKEEKLDSLLRREISEKILSFLTGFGIHQSLLQCGTLIEIDDRGEPVLDDERNEIKKQYFYAGKEVLEEDSKVYYEELPEQEPMLYDVVITEVIN